MISSVSSNLPKGHPIVKKSHIHLLSLSSIGLLLSASCFPISAASVPGPVHGLWVWKSPAILGAPRGAVLLRDFCRSEGINEVYVSVSAKSETSEEDELAELIALMHGANIRVEALFSSTDADEPGKHRDSLLDRAQNIVRFNNKHRSASFDGIHLDVEPWQRQENKGAGNLQFLPGLVDAFRAVVAIAKPAGLTVNADIAVKLLKGDPSQREMLLSSVPRFTLMMYELTKPQDGTGVEQKAEQVVKTSQKDLDMAYEGLNERNLGKMVIALRTADYGDLLPRILRALEEANQLNSHYLGWARHSYNDTLPAAQ